MNKKIIAVAALAFLCMAYVAGTAQGAGDYSRASSAPAGSTDGSKALGTGDLFFDPLTPDVSGLPSRSDLPVPANLRNKGSITW